MRGGPYRTIARNRRRCMGHIRVAPCKSNSPLRREAGRNKCPVLPRHQLLDAVHGDADIRGQLIFNDRPE